MNRPFKSRSIILKSALLVLVAGISVTSCGRKSTNVEEDTRPYISCEYPELTLPVATISKAIQPIQPKVSSFATSGTLDKLTILTLNDTHGSIQQSSTGRYGFGRVSSYINSVRDQSSLDDVVTLAAGDMFQGSALSNLTRGQAVVDVMNQVGFDAMTLGNHEFDWGIDTVLRFNDGDSSNGEAQFPLLNANIVDRVSKEPASYHNPYIVVEKENVRVGIIGLIGLGLESSIAAPMIKDYEFTSPIIAAGKYAEILRLEEAVDIVIALGHFADDSTNSGIAALSGNKKVDAIINGHLHRNTASTISRSFAAPVPIIEAGANAERVGKIELMLNNQKQVTSVSTMTVAMADSIVPDPAVEAIIASAEQEVAPLMNRIYGEMGENLYGASEVYSWAPQVIQKGMGVDVGITNSGGLRSGAFPLYTGQDVKYSNMVALMPFDNYLIYMKLPGSFLYSYFSNLISVRSGVTIKNDSTLYRVAIVDYVADNNPALFGSHRAEYTRTNILLMDLFALDVYVATSTSGSWKPKTNGASLNSICSFR